MHPLRGTLAPIEDTAEPVVLIEGIHRLRIDDTPAEIPSATELVDEVSPMCVEVVDRLGEQRDELGLRLTEEKISTTVEVRYGIHLKVSERLRASSSFRETTFRFSRR